MLADVSDLEDKYVCEDQTETRGLATGQGRTQITTEVTAPSSTLKYWLLTIPWTKDAHTLAKDRITYARISGLNLDANHKRIFLPTELQLQPLMLSSSPYVTRFVPPKSKS